ncbi:venom carboxylesterase-6 [Eurytemora carolleeae]|uniref:venom carboxylesterase-6 n=1 Tax=Eurytemora carolleeae TaxID=1294199 RepID=UPI000C76FD12|nr:venom carboxylesterase-6 [Eurytemora carolleeae]|eukprot:XP_023348100.1 venom carboxylesterase-6-like [Eurytemora affinis]
MVVEWRILACMLVMQASYINHVVQGCQTRSSHDGERMSHKGTEPDYDPIPTPGSPNSIPTDQTKESKNNVEDVDREREIGEIKVGKRWEFPVAQTKLGMLWGTVEESRGGKRILAFRGVQHVQPPTGSRRFRPPVPVQKWEGIKEAKHNGHICPQHLATKPDIWVGDEDCLWLNVFTRDLVVSKRRPVMVWIHGGNFARGSAAEYSPDYLLDQDIVLVTIQYRLGMFGFLSTEDSLLPGNYGMRDQLAALLWVKQNIEAFSGDPGQITLVGQQAGGASVHYHLLSPLTRGLFNRAVSLSGSALCWWASLKRPLERANKLAKLVDCQNQDKETMIKCLREKPMDLLMNTHPNFYEWKHLEQNQEPLTSWSPRVDVEATVPFMPQEPIDLMTSGNFQHVPFIIGVTDDEGAGRGATFFSDMAGVRDFEENFEKIGPLLFGFHDGQSEAPKIMAKKVKDFYWAEKRLDKDIASSLIDAISDSSYAHPIDTTGKIHAMKSAAPVYVYHFGYKGEFSMTRLATNEYPPKIVDTDINLGAANGNKEYT